MGSETIRLNAQSCSVETLTVPTVLSSNPSKLRRVSSIFLDGEMRQRETARERERDREREIAREREREE